MPCLFGLGMIRIVYQINRMEVDDKDGDDTNILEDDLISNIYMTSAIDFQEKSLDVESDDG